MAWIDDRIWCAPKLTDLTSPAFRAWVNAIAYSSGMHTRGRLTIAQQKLVGANAKTRLELINHGLWDLNGDGQTIYIHDWDDHNEKRDERKARDRERKRQARASERQSAGTSRGTSPGQSTGRSTATAHVERVKEVKSDKQPAPEPEPEARGAGSGAGAGDFADGDFKTEAHVGTDISDWEVIQ